MKAKIKVLVLMGGTSSEREVSLTSGRMVVKALDPRKFDVSTQDAEALLTPATIDRIGVGRPDIVFIALHGKYGEDGTVQGTLDLLGIPYTGSGVLASALAMDKSKAKALFRLNGISVCEEILFTKDDSSIELTSKEIENRFGWPIFIKPNSNGSTIGCTLAENASQLEEGLSYALSLDSRALIEPYLRGTELTAGVIGNSGRKLEALPVIEIIPKAKYYDYESKYAKGGSEHICPARIPGALADEARNIAKRCHAILGCQGMSRTDLILRDGHFYVLEVNTIPGLTPTSLLPDAACAHGIPFPLLIERIIELGLEFHGKRGVHPYCSARGGTKSLTTG